MQYAYIVNNVVEIVYSEVIPGLDMVECPDDVRQGWIYNPGTQTYAAPPPPPPPPATLESMEMYLVVEQNNRALARRMAFIDDYVQTNGMPAHVFAWRDIIAGLPEIPT